jgi:PAS domain S-box-containing protein
MVLNGGMSQAPNGHNVEKAEPLSGAGLGRSLFPLWQKAVLFGAAYFGCAEASTLVSARGSADLSFWVPSGLYLAVLLLNDFKSWPWLVLAATGGHMAFDAVRQVPGMAGLVFISADTVEAVLGAWLVRRFVARRPTMATLREFAGLLGFAGGLSTLAGATVSATGQVLAGISPSFAKSFSFWLGCNTMATLIVSPFVLVWFSTWPDWRTHLAQPKKALEAAVLFAGLIASVWWIMVLGRGINSPNKFPFIVFLFWAGLRFGVRGATTANLVFALLGGYCVQHYMKGLTPADIASRFYLLTMHAALAAGAIVGLIPAIVLAERDTTLKELRESGEKFSKAFRSSPNGIAISELASGRFIDVNDSFCRIYGYAKEEMLGRTSVALGLFPTADERERFIAPIRALGWVKNCEMRMRAHSGEPRTLLVSAERIELEGKQCIVLMIFDITARLQTEEELEKTSRQLRALTYRLQFLREEERSHVAREIHDHLGQLLTALSLDLRLIERRAANVADADVRAGLQGKIASARRLADDTITSVQKIATELRPAILDRLGLEAAIETETQAFQCRTGVHCEWELPSTPLALEPDKATAIFRIFQEILTNVARHAQAGNLAISLAQEEDELVLEVDDDGIGIKPDDSAKPTSLGLLGMRERVAILGGRITFGRGGQRGTKVVMQIPLQGKVGLLA